MDDIVFDIAKQVIGPFMGAVATYLIWITKSILKHERDLKAAFTKIRSLEEAAHDRFTDRADV